MAYMARGPISRLVYGDMTMITELMAGGFMEDLPLAFRTEHDLVEALTQWMEAHETDMPLASTRLAGQYIDREHDYVQPLYLAKTDQKVWVQRFKITDDYMGWILKDGDGSCIYVKAASGNTGKIRCYHGWLGGDKGFSQEPIASTRASIASDEDLFSPSDASSGQVQGMPPESPPKSHKAVCPKLGTEFGLSSLDAIKSRKRRMLSEPVTISGKKKQKLPKQANRGRAPIKDDSDDDGSCIDLNDTTKAAVRAHNHITFHFATSGDGLALVPASFRQCDTSAKFFTQARKTASMFAESLRVDDIVGIHVTASGLEWPLFLPNRDAHSYEGMVETLKALADTTNTAIAAKVTCVLKI